MKSVSTQTRIGGYIFPFIVEAEVETSWESLTDKVKLTVPRKLSFKGKPIVKGESLFKRGDRLSVLAGYDGSTDNIFEGYVSGIRPKTPMEFDGEDAMWQLKQKNINASYENVTLNKLLADHCDIPFKVSGEVAIGQFRIKNASMAKVLEELQKTYGLFSWIRNGTLYAGLDIWPELQIEHIFTFGMDIFSDDDLEYVREDDVKIKCKGVSMLPDNKKIEVEEGDADGEQRTITRYNYTEAQLRADIKREIVKLKYEGYRGSLTTFGTSPPVYHGDIAVLADPFNMGREGKYLIKKVVRTVGTNGYHQKLTLDRRTDTSL